MALRRSSLPLKLLRSILSPGRAVLHPPSSARLGCAADGESGNVVSGEVGGDAAAGGVKVKRKKLKGKRAVVRWLKFFRYKKKKEFERMTAEEKILFKLKKAQRKEARLMESLKKIEPRDNVETKHDPEILTPEEHFFYIRKAHKLKNYVPIGVRGISQGVILNMHLHWKKHETVQITVKTFSPDEVKELARELARLSGGIVLDIEQGNTILMYRGKNYCQPPTEIMSPKIALSRRKALDKAKLRDGLRAVRKFIPRLEQDLELLHLRTLKTKESPQTEQNGNQQSESNIEENNIKTDQSKENSNLLMKLLENDKHSGDDECSSESNMSDSETLSDMFETDSDGEVKEKIERPLFLDTVDRFPVMNESEPEDFDEHLRQISSNSKKGNPFEREINRADLDEVDELFLKASALLRKKRKQK